ncbi:hypothetical protein [Maricaulis sp.]|uniref:hypothetical protein n=1 Tax=Maricaulis sp. TaxID=1486257 RepID=UPI003A8D48D2
MREEQGRNHPILIAAVIVLSMFLVTSLFWIILYAPLGHSADADSAISQTDFAVLFAILFGSSTIILTCTTVGIALLAFFGWRGMKKAAVTAAITKAIEVAEKTALPAAREAAEYAAHGTAIDVIKDELLDGGELRSLLATRVEEIQRELLGEAPDERLLALIGQVLDSRTLYPGQSSAPEVAPDQETIEFADDEYGEPPSSIRRDRNQDGDDGDKDSDK